ncbi:hypothetical protein L2E82_34621 [Cichorium intybus]|uniref:Uncharacterized protein n=1 Tax=Cichorium intybus TaxID=13427 RepID=A0ACB9BMF9_CICIN|nr:hypothetical protein L2E82_34621 [Cichorium intybus]
MDAPPSISSVIIRNFDQQQPQVNEPSEFGEEQYNPSISDIRAINDQSQSQYNQSFKAMTVDSTIDETMETYGDFVQPVSIGDMAAIRREEIQHHQFPDQHTVVMSDSSEQMPSIGSMVREGEISQAGGGNFSTYDAPPSRTDVAHRDASYTGESNGGQDIPNEDYQAVSLTGRNFGKFYTMELPKEEA